MKVRYAKVSDLTVLPTAFPYSTELQETSLASMKSLFKGEEIYAVIGDTYHFLSSEAMAAKYVQPNCVMVVLMKPGEQHCDRRRRYLQFLCRACCFGVAWVSVRAVHSELLLVVCACSPKLSVAGVGSGIALIVRLAGVAHTFSYRLTANFFAA